MLTAQGLHSAGANIVGSLFLGLFTLGQAAEDIKAEELFIELLRRFNKSGRNVCQNSRANNYAPTLFAAEPEAKQLKLRRKDFEAAMSRRFAKDKLVVETYGPPSKSMSRILER
jgi:hypothetical protein